MVKEQYTIHFLSRAPIGAHVPKEIIEFTTAWPDRPPLDLQLPKPLKISVTSYSTDNQSSPWRETEYVTYRYYGRGRLQQGNVLFYVKEETTNGV